MTPLPPNPQNTPQGTPEGQAALAELAGKVEGSKAWLVEDAGYDDMAIDTFWEVRAYVCTASVCPLLLCRVGWPPAIDDPSHHQRDTDITPLLGLLRRPQGAAGQDARGAARVLQRGGRRGGGLLPRLVLPLPHRG